MYSIENKSEDSRAIQNNSEKHESIAQFKDNRSLSIVEVGENTAQLEKKENLTGMPDDLKEGIESFSGFSMDKRESTKTIQRNPLNEKAYLDIYIDILDMNENNDIRENIREKFFIKKNIDTLINKLFLARQKETVDGAISHLVEITNPIMVKTILYSTQKAIHETLGDIQYWSQGRSVKEIELTDSDMHTRGVGVCIVTYIDKKGTEEKCVIKPENKSLEKAIYGANESNQEKSLAEKFENIGTMKIDVSNSDKFHGSKVEYVEHKRAKLISSSQVDDKQMRSLIHFSSVLGLKDLHYENWVYRVDNSPQLIDAEIALWGIFKDLQSVIDDGEASKAMPDGYITQKKEDLKKASRKEIEKYMKFLDIVEGQFRGKRSRIVPIETGNLYMQRYNVYIDGTVGKNFINELRKGLRLTENVPLDDVAIIKCTNEILSSGKIPFFEYKFDDGEIVLKKLDATDFSIYKNKDLELHEVIQKRKNQIAGLQIEEII